jgi:hypothetical protein
MVSNYFKIVSVHSKGAAEKKNNKSENSYGVDIGTKSKCPVQREAILHQI